MLIKNFQNTNKSLRIASIVQPTVQKPNDSSLTATNGKEKT